MKIQITLYTLLLLSFFACKSGNKNENAENQKTESQTTLNPNWNFKETEAFSFSYPKNWELVGDGSQGTTFIVVSPRIDSTDVFSESVNLVTQNVGEVTLDDYVELSESQIEQYMENSTILSRKREIVDNITFHYFIFKAKDQGTEFIFEQRYAIKEGIAYILTYTAEVPQYEAMKPLADVVINSFKLK